MFLFFGFGQIFTSIPSQGFIQALRSVFLTNGLVCVTDVCNLLILAAKALRVLCESPVWG